MWDRIQIRVFIWLRDRWVKRLVRQGISGNSLLDHPMVKKWQMFILAVKGRTDAKTLVIESPTDRSASEISGVVCKYLQKIRFKEWKEECLLEEWIEEIQKARCRVIEDHMWTHDHCGYWGHMYCAGCGKLKYEELARLSCSEANEFTDGRTEESYQQKKAEDERNHDQSIRSD